MRINVYEYPSDADKRFGNFEPTLTGWFDWNKATRWSDGDHNGNGSRGTGRGQAVILTSGGKWVLENWTRWHDEADEYSYITAGQAREWMLAHNEDAAVAEHFSPIAEEEDRRPGRPEIGGNVHVRLGDELLARVNRWAEGQGLGQAEAIRLLVKAGFERFGL